MIYTTSQSEYKNCVCACQSAYCIIVKKEFILKKVLDLLLLLITLFSFKYLQKNTINLKSF